MTGIPRISKGIEKRTEKNYIPDLFIKIKFIPMENLNKH